MQTFQARLREVRIGQELKVRRRQRLTDEELGLNDGLGGYLEARDQLFRSIEELMQDFVSISSAFSIQHGFFEGKASLTLAVCEIDTRGSHQERTLTRITFILSSYRENEAVELVSKITAGNRDLHTQRRRTRIEDSSDLGRLREFAMDQMLQLARAYFSFSAGRRREPAESHRFGRVPCAGSV